MACCLSTLKLQINMIVIVARVSPLNPVWDPFRQVSAIVNLRRSVCVCQQVVSGMILSAVDRNAFSRTHHTINSGHIRGPGEGDCTDGIRRERRRRGGGGKKRRKKKKEKKREKEESVLCTKRSLPNDSQPGRGTVVGGVVVVVGNVVMGVVVVVVVVVDSYRTHPPDTTFLLVDGALPASDTLYQHLFDRNV